MTGCEQTLQKNAENIRNVNRLKVQKVLLLYEENDFYVGDTCIRIEFLRNFKSFFENAGIYVNCNNHKLAEIFGAIIENNPNVDGFSNLQWEHLEIENYDVIFCLSHEENHFLTFLHNYFRQKTLEFPDSIAVFSLSKYVTKPREIVPVIFPVYYEFLDYTKNKEYNETRKLYVTDVERTWGDNWLLAHDLKEHEQVCILIDTTKDKRKLIGTTVYFELLEYLINNKQNRILIFDETDVGKAEFYTKWLGKENAGRIIFTKGNSLREAIKILSSRYVKLIIGPCTGTLHLASGIYNYLAEHGLPVDKIPLIITYTGVYYTETEKEEKNAHFWWKNSPLVTCLLLRQHNDQVKVAELRELNVAEAQRLDAQIPCSTYTSRMLIDVICAKQPLLGA
jgi:ADP-heptose:LPS heptosyltransferase